MLISISVNHSVRCERRRNVARSNFAHIFSNATILKQAILIFCMPFQTGTMFDCTTSQIGGLRGFMHMFILYGTEGILRRVLMIRIVSSRLTTFVVPYPADAYSRSWHDVLGRIGEQWCAAFMCMKGVFLVPPQTTTSFRHIRLWMTPLRSIPFVHSQPCLFMYGAWCVGRGPSTSTLLIFRLSAYYMDNDYEDSGAF